MDDDQLLRYSRQIMLAGLDIEGQERLLGSRVLVVGLGGLGSPLALYLAAAGVGSLVVADGDRVELSNLQRQILFRTDDVGRMKTDVALERVGQVNPEVRVSALAQRLDASNLPAALAGVDLVVDGSDNFATRFAVNAACVAAGVPLVSGAVIRMEGQVAVFPNGGRDAACYRCIFPETGELEETCSDTGVLAPLPGVVGSLQAVEAIKLLTGLGEPLVDRLLVLDALAMEWRSFRLRRDPACPVCGKRQGPRTGD